MPEIDKTSLQMLLLGIDEEAYMTIGSVARRPEVVIVGGGAFMLLDLTVRQSTHDVDVLQASSLVREILARHPAVNDGVAAYVDQLPYNFEDRLIRLELDTLCMDYFTPSVEDLVVMKLYAWRPNDNRGPDERQDPGGDRLGPLGPAGVFGRRGQGTGSERAEVPGDGGHIRAVQGEVPR